MIKNEDDDRASILIDSVKIFEQEPYLQKI